MNVIAFIPARCGSKSIKLKNIQPFCGRPLIYWNLFELQKTKEIDQIVVATDCQEIVETVNSFSFSKVNVFLRSSDNASDTSSTEAVMLEFIEKSPSGLDKSDIFILVQATSPFTRSEDFLKGLDLFYKEKFDSLLSCARLKRFFWTEEGVPVNYDYNFRPRRQDFDGQLIENGAFYINTVGNILQNKNRLGGKIGLYEMSPFTFIELDEDDDWVVAEKFMKKYILPPLSRTKEIKFFLSDIDGVLTDAGMYYSENGDEMKKFNTQDGMGFKLLNEKGIRTGLITSENNNLNSRRADKLKIDFLFQGVKNKLQVALDFCKKLDIDLNQVAFIGDDINDFELLNQVGLAACPANAVNVVKDIPGIIRLSKSGGDGAVREFIDVIL